MKNKLCGIYKITNPKGKIYIGQSIDLIKRFKDYKYFKCKSQLKIYNSLKKYTFDNHKFEIIEECVVDELNNKERYWQDFYNVLGINGLNCKLTKSGDKSGKMSSESIRKGSLKNKGKTWSQETKDRVKKMKEERIKNGWIDIKIGSKRSEETIKKNISSRKYSTLSSDHKQKISDSISILVVNLETGIFYKSIKEASHAHNITYRNLVRYLSGKRKNKTSFEYA